MKTQAMTLFCIPFSGGSHYSYQTLTRLLPDTIRVVTLELPGRGRRFGERLLRDAHAMTDDLFRQVQDQLTEPYAFFGHSLGAALAGLLTRRIQRAGLPQPVHLFVSGKGGLSVPSLKKRHLLERASFLQEVVAFGGMAPELIANEGLLDLFEPILRADIQASETYQYQPQLVDVPMDVLVGTEDIVTLEEANTWCYETTHPVAVHIFKGNHFFLFGHETAICELIVTRLAAYAPPHHAHLIY